jgi:hypothetical protein
LRIALRGLRLAALAALVAGSVMRASAQSPGPLPDPAMMPTPTQMSPATMESRADRRFAQPVRVGDLEGRALLQPLESQPVLGHVLGAAQHGGTEQGLVVRLDGGPVRPWLHWLGIGDRRVLVPLAGVALLGEHVALLGYTPQQLDALPDYKDDAAARIGADSMIHVALTGPFH